MRLDQAASAGYIHAPAIHHKRAVHVLASAYSKLRRHTQASDASSVTVCGLHDLDHQRRSAPLLPS